MCITPAEPVGQAQQMCIYIPKNVNEMVNYGEFICRLTADAMEDPLIANRRARGCEAGLTSRRAGTSVVPSTVGSAESADAGGVLSESVAGAGGASAGGASLPAAGVGSALAAGVSDPALGGVASPAGAGLAVLGSPVAVGSATGAEEVEEAAPVDAAGSTTGAEDTMGAAAASTGAAVVEAPTTALGVAESSAAVVAAAAGGVANASAGRVDVVWETDTMVVPDPPVPGIVGRLGRGIVIETAEGVTPVCAALAPAAFPNAAAAASAGVSWTVVLVTTRVVFSFMEVAGSRFS